jgi:aspartate ammonia-lyase
MSTRIEHDALGELAVPEDALYGIHTARAIANFPLAHRPIRAELVHAYGAVKLACAQTNHEQGSLSEPVWNAISSACREMMAGTLDHHIRVDALQGGAGTSTNMNVNEVLANRALQHMQQPLGSYDQIDPLADINLHQSTNDTYPTALRVAAITSVKALEASVIELQEAFQAKEKDFAHVVKVGRTQLQDAVLTTMGRTMSAFAEAFSRDRWRLYKCEERLRVVNLGGTAIGTGLGAPRQYIFRVTEVLRSITGLGLARAENLVEATQNADVFVEVSGILKACASNLLKISGDLRLMASGPSAGLGEFALPKCQAGSSIMPGKVNPVIPEAVSQAAITVIANDVAITQAVSMGNLELNAFMPLIADNLLESLSLLQEACRMLARRCVTEMQVNEEACTHHVGNSGATATALVEHLGYETAGATLAEAIASGLPLPEILEECGLMDQETFEELISPENVTKLGSNSDTEDEAP